MNTSNAESASRASREVELTNTTAIILDHLKQAATAHGVHEAADLAGVYDQQWPEWYAAHMTRTLRDAGYLLTRAT
jgi:hypothetical protein